LFAFTVVTGVTWAFVDPVRQTLVPALVPREDLMNAVALNSAAFNLTKIIGPSLGGALIVFCGAGGNFFVQSLAYLGVLASIYWTAIPPTPAEARQSSAVANLKEGLVYVWSNPSVFALMAPRWCPGYSPCPTKL
jgi:MFS family permease